MMTMLEMVNDVLRRVGRTRVAALDTTGTSSHAEVERCIEDASRRIQATGWHFNTLPKVSVTPDGSNNIVASTVAAVPVLHLDAPLDESWKNYTVRNGNVYDIDNKTDEFTGAINLRLVLKAPVADLPDTAAQHVVLMAAAMYLSLTGQHERTRVLVGEAMATHAAMMREEIEAADVNILDQPDAVSVRGRPAYRFLEGYINNA